VADDFLRELRAVAARGRRRARAAPEPSPREALMDEALHERLPTLMAGR